MLSKDYDLFYNLIDLSYNGNYYDLHNDFYCVNIKFENDTLALKFEHSEDKSIVELCFKGSKIVNFDFNQIMDKLTIDNIYRGRFEKNNELFEFSDDKKSYFYIEFYEDIKIELFTEEIFIV